MAQLTYRQAVAAAIAQEIERDPAVMLLGEDVGAAGGVFKATEGLFERFGPGRVWDTPISEQAIVGTAMGAAMMGIRPVAEIMFSDFLATCWDGIANEIAKMRYMTGGQVCLPLVIRCANGAGVFFGAQHSQSTENWAMAIPGLKVVVPSSPEDVKGLLAASIRDDDPVIFFEHKELYATSGEVPDGDFVLPLGQAKILRRGSDVTLVALAATVRTALQAAERLEAEDGVRATVIDLRCLVPLDVATVRESLEETGRLVIVEETPRPLGWGAELCSILVEEAFDSLDAPIVRVTAEPVPLPATPSLERLARPSVERTLRAVRGFL
ncbi:MAG TPA: alpha-ketoacid dehydrogenase subunit beta [Chloroflexota bacterium]|nr:alpha-ketoacid dehydrogenase subunit beta [Chloroflexota bacterium]